MMIILTFRQITIMKCKHLLILLLMITLGVGFANAKTYLVSVGIADYSSFPSKITNLRLPPEDAKVIANLYAKNTTVKYSLLTDKKATKKNIIKAMTQVFNEAGPDDIVILFFSGLGYPGGFCAADDKLSYKEVRQAMAKSKSKNKMILVDACHSGGVRVDAQSGSVDETNAKKANVMMFLSCRNTENSIESSNMSNGFFTTYLQKGLRGNADSNKDRKITAKELYDFVHDGVVRLSRGQQHPVMWGKFNDNMPVMIW